MKDNSNITPELLETVEQYYKGSMAPQQRMAFEKELNDDPNFKVLVEDIRTTLLGIESQALKEQLETFHKDIPETNPLLKKAPNNSRFFNFINLGIAAVLLIGLGLFWFNRSPSSDQIYKQYFKVDPGLPTTMSTTDNFVFYDAMVNYKQGDYEKAISKWKTLEQKAPENDTLNYFLGVAYMANNHADQAVPYLNKTIMLPESVFLEDAYYYLGLAYLKTKKVEAAKAVFQQSQAPKSKEILKELN